ncbi:protein FAM60A-like [Arapaima gigas]
MKFIIRGASYPKSTARVFPHGFRLGNPDSLGVGHACGIGRLPAPDMFGFHKSKVFRSHEGCCICKTKSSSSRFTDSSRYEENFRLCFGLAEDRFGDICNACVLLVKRWKKLPLGSKKNWNHVVDARAGPGFKLNKPKKSSDGKKKSKLKRLHKLKRQNSDAHSTTSSTSPCQSPSYSNQSDEGSDIEAKQSRSTPSLFSYLDLTYWKRQKVCCGIVYKGRYGEVMIDPRLFKPCCSSKKQEAPPPEPHPATLPEDLKESR